MSAPRGQRRTIDRTESFADEAEGGEPCPPDLPSRYTIRHELGRGGMATVYAAFDHQLGRDVAVKYLRGEDSRRRIRFAREAHLVARLRHPAIVTIHDVDPDGQYLVMELLDGGSVAGRVCDGRVDLALVRRWAGQLLAGLAAAHACGVVHRDVKPSNLLLTATGDLKLADFGVAAVDAPGLTVDGARVGTPAYMAPEQLRGDSRAPTVDIYAVGATLYELCTGHRLHERRPVNRDVAAALIRAGGDRTFATAIARAVADDPRDRFADAAVMAAALTAAQPTRRWPWLAAIAAMVTALLLVGGGIAARSGSPRPPPPASVAPRVAMLAFVDNSGEPSLDYASYGLPHVLTSRWQALPELAVIEYPRLRQHLPATGGDDAAWRHTAAALGATLVVDGEVRRAGPQVTLIVRLRRVDGREVATWEATVAASELPATLRRLAAPVASAALTRVVVLDAGPPESAVAERALQRGIEALDQFDLPTADRELSTAVMLAPGNPEAAYYRAVFLWWRGAMPDAVRAAIAAIPVDELPASRRDAIAGLRLFIDHRYVEAIAWFEAAVARHPGDRDLRYGLFEARFHGGDPVGALAAFRALRDRYPRFSLGAIHVFDYALLHDDDALVSWAKSLGAPQYQALWSAEAEMRRGDYALAAQRLQAELDRPHTRGETDVYIQRALTFALALQGHAEFAREIAPSSSRWPLRWALAEAASDRSIAAEQAAYQALRAGQSPGLGRVTIAMESAIMLLAAARPVEQHRAVAARLAADMPPERTHDSSPSMVRVFLAIALGDDAELAAATASPLPEVRLAATAARLERAGDLAGAAAHWKQARAIAIDARLVVLENVTLARLARAVGDRQGLIDACQRVVRPTRPVEAWGPASVRCRAWLAEVGR